MQFDAQNVVWVRIANPERDPWKISEVDHKTITRFMDWLWKQQIFPAFTTSTGAGQWHGAFFLDDWEVVWAWLRENGIFDGPYERRKT